METQIILAMFKTKDGVDDATVRDATARSTAVLTRSGGLVRRELARDDESGQWIEVVHMTDPASAKRAIETFADAPEAQDFVALIDSEQSTLQQLRSVLVQ